MSTRLRVASGTWVESCPLAWVGTVRIGESSLAWRMPVVLASRCAAGPVLTATCRGAGVESDLIAQGLLPAANLQRARRVCA